ncbi:MAG TPA: SLBB domain-containing protein [Gemmatirosa sp.]
MFALAHAAGAGAQSAPPARPASAPNTAAPPLGGASSGLPSGVSLPTGPLLDAPVSRTQYRVGPGDVLDVALLGDLTRVFAVGVAPEGTVLIPGVGLTRVLGLNIDDAERRIRDLVLRYYRNVEVRVSLAQVRSFKVFVVGDVAAPGVRNANAATRVSEVLPDAPTDGSIRHRNVILRRSSGDSLSIDLLRFRQTGDLSANPMLREGDAIIVPIIDRTIQVYGRVAFPGTYEYRRGETLRQLLAVANGAGPFPADAADTVRVARFTGAEQREFRVFSRVQAGGPEGDRLVLEPSDAIFVPSVANYKVQKTAAITGQVLRPGTYPIRPETTTVRELVALAGGFTADASLGDASLRRVPPASELQGARQLASVPQDLLTSEERRVLQARSQADPTRVVIDFQALFSGGRDALDQPLEAGDSLTVPVRRTGVTVVGAVTNPGIVPYAPGQGINYYVDLAGGYARRADRGGSTLLRARLGGRADATDARDIRNVNPGDQIVVPFRERSRLLQDFQTAAAIVGTVTGTLFSLYTIRQLARGQ